MAIKSKPYEQFGSYILFKRLEGDSLGDLWRAGRIEGQALGETVALRRLSGGDREAFSAAARHAGSIAAAITGTTVVKNQVIGVEDGIPFVAHEYMGGRSLRHIVDRARGGTSITPNPVPIDQGLAIVEKVANSLETLANLKFHGARLTHGALIPQFIWISDDGEVRTAGHQMGRGLVASLARTEIAKELGPYFAPELREAGESTKSSDVYSLGAILYLVLTGQEPPDVLNPAFFDLAIQRATLMINETPLPDDLRPILRKSLALDPATRYPSAKEMRQDIGNLIHGGQYSPTTFNLAFYLHNLLKKEMDGEAIDREKESKTQLAPYLESMPAAIAPDPEEAAGVPEFMGASLPAEKRRFTLPLIAAIVAIVAIGAIAAAYYFGFSGKANEPSSRIAATRQTTPPGSETSPSAPVITVASLDAVTTAPAITDTAGAAGALNPEALRRAREEAINRRLQQEMLKLQAEYDRDLEQQSDSDQVTSTPPQPAISRPQPVQEEEAPTAAELDQARRAQIQADNPPPTVTIAPDPAPPQTQTAAPAPAQTTEAVREGDLVDFNRLDQAPRLLGQIRPVYPPIAVRQRLEANIIVSVLVSETGRVLDVRILKGDPRKVGFDEAAMRAIRNASFSPATKDGKRVRTWMPQSIRFVPSS